jgi:hypothetical protein
VGSLSIVKSLLRLKDAPTLEGGEELRQVFTYTGVSLFLNISSGIEVRGLKAHLSEKWKRLMTARKVKEYTGTARRYMRITGLGFGKHAHVLACDDVETLLHRRGLKLSAATSLTASA